jgi:hypothetical protein
VSASTTSTTPVTAWVSLTAIRGTVPVDRSAQRDHTVDHLDPDVTRADAKRPAEYLPRHLLGDRRVRPQVDPQQITPGHDPRQPPLVAHHR